MSDQPRDMTPEEAAFGHVGRRKKVVDESDTNDTHHTRAVIDGHTVVVEWVGKKDESELSNAELMARIESKLSDLKGEVEG